MPYGSVTLKTSKNILISGHIATQNGNITMEANQQAVPTAASFIGINISGASAIVESTGTGAITLLSKGGKATSNPGVQVINSGSTVRGGFVPGGDSVTIVGQGVAGNSIGAFIPNGDIFTLAGDIRITGRGFGSGAGSQIQNGSTIQPATNYNVIIDAASQNPTGSEAALNMLNIGTVATGIFTTGTGTITLIADSFSLRTTGTLPPVIDAGTSTGFIRPKTAGHNIDIGSTATLAQAGVLDISDTELDRITAGTIQIGDSNSGAINITNAISPASYKTLSIPKAVAFTSGATTGSFDSDVFSATDYEKIRVAGAVTIHPAAQFTMSAVGGFVPTALNSFTIIENTSADMTTGTFGGKPEGAQVAVGGVNKTFTYVGGPGANDVVLRGLAVDLAVTIENIGNDDNVVPGETITYMLSYANNGTLAATGVFIRDTAPIGTTIHADSLAAGWFLESPGVYRLNIAGSLATAGTGSVEIKYIVESNVPAGMESIVHSATIADDGASGPDAEPNNNTSTDTDTLIAAPDLAITSTSNGVTSARPGETLTYTINYANLGNQGATNVVLTDTLPVGTSFTAADNPGWTNNGGLLSLAIGSLAAGANGSASLKLVVTNPAAADQVDIVNTVTISDDDTNGADPSENDSAQDTDALLPLGVPTPVTISANGRTATFTDVDGDLITVKITAGTLEQSNFVVMNNLFAKLDLTNGGADGISFAGSKVIISAKRTAAGGDGLVNLGYLDATGIDLGKVVLNGDLGRLDVGDATTTTPAVTSLHVQSMGRFGTSTQFTLVEPNLTSTVTGGLPLLKVRSDLFGVSFSLTGDTNADLGRALIGGSIENSTLSIAGGIGLLKVSGSIEESQISSVESIGTISAGAVAGTYKLAGGLTVTGSIVSSTIATDGDLSSLKAGGSVSDSPFLVRGDLAPTTLLEARTIGTIAVKGSVEGSEVLVGYNRAGAPVNPDVQVGTLNVGAAWIASNVAIGVVAGPDGDFATDDDAAIAGGNALIASRLDRGVIKGHNIGVIDSADTFGVAAQEIGRFNSGRATLALTQDPGNGLVSVASGAVSSESSGAAAPVLTLSANGRTATFLDTDGDLVTVRTSRGSFVASDFTIVPMNGSVAGGGQLALLDLANDVQFAGATISITAKPCSREPRHRKDRRLGPRGGPAGE